jgi:hypothetical protein
MGDKILSAANDVMDISYGAVTLLFTILFLYGYLHDDEAIKDALTSSAPVPIAISLCFG